MSLTDNVAGLTGERSSGSACCSLATYTGGRERRRQMRSLGLLASSTSDTGGDMATTSMTALSVEQELTHHYRWTTGDSLVMSALVPRLLDVVHCTGASYPKSRIRYDTMSQGACANHTG